MSSTLISSELDDLRLSRSRPKSVVFSPRRLESCSSIPGKVKTPAKGILKTPSKLLPDERPLLTSSPPPQLTQVGSEKNIENIVLATVEALRNGDEKIRTEYYQMLHTRYRESSDNLPFLDDTEMNITVFSESFRRDVSQNHNTELAHAALRCMGFFLFHGELVIMFDDVDLQELLILVANKIRETSNKNTCNFCVWCLAIQRLKPNTIYPLVPRLVEALVFALVSNFKSITMQMEAISALGVIFKQVPTSAIVYSELWLLEVVRSLVHNMSGIRSRAMQLLENSLSNLVLQPDIIDRALGNFLDIEGATFTRELDKLIFSGEEIHAIKAWGVVVLLLGEKLHRNPNLNAFLKCIEKCFNVKKPAVKAAAFAAWTKFIYNFSLNGHILMIKRIKLIRVPIENCLRRERSRAVKEACIHTWANFMYASSEVLTEYFDGIVGDMMQLSMKSNSPLIRNYGFQIMSCLLCGRSNALWNDINNPLKSDAQKPAEAIRRDPQWIRRNSKKFCEFFHISLSMQYLLESQSSDEWHLCELSEKRIVTNEFVAAWNDFLAAIQQANQKEIGPSREAIDSLHECLRMWRQVWETDESNMTNVIIEESEERVNPWVVKLGILHFMLQTYEKYFTASVLTSIKYSLNEEEAKVQEDQHVTPIHCTPIVYILNMLLSVPANALVDKQVKNILIMLINKSFQIAEIDTELNKMLSCSLSLLETRLISSDKILNIDIELDYQMEAWQCIALSLEKYIRRSGQIFDIDIAQDQLTMTLLEVIIYPLRKYLEQSVTPSDDLEMGISVALSNLLESYYKATTYLKANTCIDLIAARIQSALDSHNNTIQNISCLRIITNLTTYMLSLNANSAAFNADSNHTSREQSVFQSLYKLSTSLLKYLYLWLDNSAQNPKDVPGFIKNFFTELTTLLVNTPSENNIFDLLSDGILTWIKDDDHHVRDQTILVKKKYGEMLSAFWKEGVISGLCRGQNVYTTELLTRVQEYIVVGFDSWDKSIEESTYSFWENTFKKQGAIEYPPEVARVLEKREKEGHQPEPNTPQNQEKTEVVDTNSQTKSSTSNKNRKRKRRELEYLEVESDLVETPRSSRRVRRSINPIEISPKDKASSVDPKTPKSGDTTCTPKSGKRNRARRRQSRQQAETDTTPVSKEHTDISNENNSTPSIKLKQGFHKENAMDWSENSTVVAQLGVTMPREIEITEVTPAGAEPTDLQKMNVDVKILATVQEEEWPQSPHSSISEDEIFTDAKDELPEENESETVKRNNEFAVTSKLPVQVETVVTARNMVGKLPALLDSKESGSELDLTGNTEIINSATDLPGSGDLLVEDLLVKMQRLVETPATMERFSTRQLVELQRNINLLNTMAVDTISKRITDS
ncbi:uncharacterized protein VTP21DRAFT_9432 [Calcarisporiella thermophila]|uniref:uncharacterized protein n=1 Tax=Calcarisporiella thermophila TaxID=911321 RepID=UPI00374462AB